MSVTCLCHFLVTEAHHFYFQRCACWGKQRSNSTPHFGEPTVWGEVLETGGSPTPSRKMVILTVCPTDLGLRGRASKSEAVSISLSRNKPLLCLHRQFKILNLSLWKWLGNCVLFFKHLLKCH